MPKEMTQENTQTENTELENNPETEEATEQPVDEVSTEETSDDTTDTADSTQDEAENEVSTDIPDEYYNELNNIQQDVQQFPAQTSFQQTPEMEEYLKYKKFKEIEKQEASAAHEKAKTDAFLHKLNVASKTIPNFQKNVVLNPAFTNEYGGISDFGQQTAEILQDPTFTDNPIPLLNYLGNQGAAELKALKEKKLGKFALALEYAKLNEKLNNKIAPKKVSQAPKPIEPISNQGSGEMPATDFSNPKLSYKERKALRKQQKKQT